MMGVVIRHRGAGMGFAQHLEASARPGKGGQSFGSLLRRGAQQHGPGGGRGSIEDVVISRHLQPDLGKRTAPVHQRKATIQPAQMPDRGRIVVVGILPAEGEKRSPLPCRFRYGTAGSFVAAVIQDGTGLAGKAGIAFHGVFHRVEIFHVVVIDIEDQRDIGVRGKEGIPELAGFVDEALGLAGTAVAADGAQLAADDGGRVQPRRVQDLHDHGGGGGFAVGPADPQRIPVPAGDRPQHPGPLPQRQAAFPRGNQLGVGFHDGGGIEDEIGAPDILGPLAHHDLDAHGALQLHDVAFVIIAAGDGIAPAVQDLYQREHPAAADADTVDVPDPLGDGFDRFVHMMTATF